MPQFLICKVNKCVSLNVLQYNLYSLSQLWEYNFSKLVKMKEGGKGFLLTQGYSEESQNLYCLQNRNASCMLAM